MRRPSSDEPIGPGESAQAWADVYGGGGDDTIVTAVARDFLDGGPGAELAAILNALPRDAFTFLQPAQRKSRSSNGLGNMMRKWCDDAGLPECTSHGLRKACARRLADAGATPHEIQAVTGHKTLKEVERYTAAAGRAGLADTGFEKLSAWSKRERVVANHPARVRQIGGQVIDLQGGFEGLAHWGGFEPRPPDS